MALARGSRLGPYEIMAPLGAGGMGEVYRARDPRLGRDVAIKLLPDAFASDPERLARFEREAKLLASLQHANIAVLHGLEEAGGRRFLVMQCVEGESLAQRLARGALPVPEAMEIAVAIAAALEVAHESGIVHRDLKPGNVMVTPAGDVKVLDFGLAKGGGGSSSDTGLSASPTMTYAATSAGVILGTAAYMSPEQARGKAVDRRTDIWSFGCVLFEMFTGKQAFAGETVSDIVACILQTEPDWSALPAATPGRVRDLLVRCLQKDARRRLRDIGDARIELEDVISGRVSASGAHLATATTVARPQPWWLLAAGAVAIAVVAWFAARALAPAAPAVPVRFQVDAPKGQILPSDAVAQAISPDGQTLAMIASDSAGVQRIWIRRLDSVVPKQLPGTDRVTMMFWSPDSRSLAFCANDRQLSRVAIAGGDPEPICDIKTARGGSWNRAGVILIAPYSNGAIYRVPASGGDPVPVVRPDSSRGETGLRFPYFLPDGRHFLYSSLPTDSSGKGRVCIASLDGGAPKVLLHAEGGAIYAEPGWVLFTRRGALVAQRLDPHTLKLAGDPIALGDMVFGSSFGGATYVTASRTGTLAFATYDMPLSRFAWLDPQGRELAHVAAPAGVYFRPLLSPDEHHALVMGLDVTQANFVALVDLDRGVVSPVTPPGTQSSEAMWSPDGQKFVCIEEAGREVLVVHSLLDESRHEYLAADPAFKRIDSWSADGRFIVYERLDSATKWDLWVLPVDGSGPPRPLLHSVANEQHSSLSPDGRWLAFESDQSGVNEVYVLPFDGSGMRYQVTNGGGGDLGWTKDGRYLTFYLANRPNTIMHASIRPGATFSMSPPEVHGHVPEDMSGADFDRTGTRLLALLPAEKARPQTFTVLQSWQASLRKP